MLDSTLKPISYSDYFNFDLIKDLGFGYLISPVLDNEKWNTAEGYGNSFLIDNNGKPLCDAKYDNFELIDGKIYGIRNEVYKQDEDWGDLYYDENGDTILLQEYGRDLIGKFEK